MTKELKTEICDGFGKILYQHGANTHTRMSSFGLKEGTKNDQAKPRMELLDAEWLEEVAWVLTHGAKEYSDHNWRSGLKLSRIIGAILRHTCALLRGEDIDKDTGRSHAAHLSCECMFFFWTLKHRPELDDRYKDAVHKT